MTSVNRAQPPDTDGRWRCPQGVVAVRHALDRCHVPIDANRGEARRRLELAGIHVAPDTLTRALRARRTQEQP